MLFNRAGWMIHIFTFRNCLATWQGGRGRNPHEQSGLIFHDVITEVLVYSLYTKDLSTHATNIMLFKMAAGRKAEATG